MIAMDHKVLVPFLLVFGTLPTVPVKSRNTRGQKKRIEMMKGAREEAAKLKAEPHSATAIN